MLREKIIIQVIYYEWVEILVWVRKKNGEIRLRVNFRNVNIFSLKDNYHFPKMDQKLQNVVNSKKMSMLDVFQGYNQVRMDHDDVMKSTFMTL